MTNSQFLIPNERGNDQGGVHAALLLWHWSLIRNWEFGVSNWQVTGLGKTRMRNRFAALICILPVVIVHRLRQEDAAASPDRFPPRLQEVDTRTRSQVALVFDEEINGAKLRPDSFLLTGPAGETLALRGASLGSNTDEVQLWTPIQEVKLYEVRGTVSDRAGNKTHFRRGSAARPSRIRLLPGSRASTQRREPRARSDGEGHGLLQ